MPQNSSFSPEPSVDSAASWTGQRPLRVAVLVDLPRRAASGGHVKGWERLTEAAAKIEAPFTLTTFFSGPDKTERLAPHVTIRQLPPVFSTSRLSFLPYVPDHTDLAPHHPALARELAGMDVIHTTDAYFTFAQTAARLAHRRGIPLVTGIHTDTPSYTRIFAGEAISKTFGKSVLARFLTDQMQIPARLESSMQQKLRRHLSQCRAAFALRAADQALAAEGVGAANLHALRAGYDPEILGPHRADRAGLCADFGVPPDCLILLFVGRVDVGKNIHCLLSALEELRKAGLPFHLITAGEGPAEPELRARLGRQVTTAGFVSPPALGRLYASADLFVLPSEVETRSLACAEALISGTPALVSSVSGVAANYGNISAILPVGSAPEDWARAIHSLAGDPVRRAAMRAAALREMPNHISPWQSLVRDRFLPVWRRAAMGPDQRNA